MSIEKDFEHKGYRCIVVMTDMGHRCGYVGIPKEHPLHGVSYSNKCKILRMAEKENKPVDLDKKSIIAVMCSAFDDNNETLSPDMYFDVHGGLTYSETGGGYPVSNSEDLWFFGYDCAHAGDARDLSVIPEKSREIWSTCNYGTVRTLDYCIEECKSLAEQLYEVAQKTVKV